MSSVATLRAMAVNYANGHNWDHLDTEACIKAAAEIEQLTRQRDELLEVLESLCNTGYSRPSSEALEKARSAIASVKGEAK